MEIEIKYSLPEENSFAAANDEEILAHASAWRARPMSSRYYDNDRHELRGRQYTLRFRHEGDERICCVKYGGNNGSDGIKFREELEFPAESIEEGVKILLTKDIPEEFKTALRRPLEVSARVEFQRRTALLTFDRFTCEMAMDEGILGKDTAFREIEFELKSGDADAMLAFCKKIAEKYGLTPQYESKLARALRA